jgi:esterase/lipase superfamily enzyme
MPRLSQLLACLTCLFLVACATPPTFVAPSKPIAQADIQRVYLATDRRLSADLSGTTVRAGALSFAQYDITIPPVHKRGVIELSKTDPNPAKVFTVADAEKIPSIAEFGSLVRSQIGPSGRPLDGTVLYIHGFNTSMETAVYQHAQIAHDYGLIGPQVTFSWPSIQKTAGYVRDKDSILIARDHLEELIVELTRDQKKVFLFAHSMGTQLLVDTLRQMSISGREDVLRQIGGVILISPDIDMDVFEALHERIDPFPQPFVVMTTQNDYALKFSSLLTAQPERVGSAKETQRIADLGILVLDLTKLPNSRDHFLAATSPVVIDIVNRVRKADATNPFPRRGVIDVSLVSKGQGY